MATDPKKSAALLSEGKTLATSQTAKAHLVRMENFHCQTKHWDIVAFNRP